LKEYFNREPGPGTYNNIIPILDDTVPDESQSKKGYLNGFVSKADRFMVSADQQDHDPTI